MINSFIKGKAVINPTIHRNDLGEIHREDGPAIEGKDFQEWRVRNKKHRIGGPAVIHGNHQEFWEMNRKHRLDGPAVIDDTHGDQWWIEGKRLTEVEFLLRQNIDPRQLLHKAKNKSEIKKIKEKLLETGTSSSEVEELILAIKFKKELT